MPPHTQKRMPLSCEPCRRRKIRCFGSEVPCDTCVKRGRAAGCHFLKEVCNTTPDRVVTDETNRTLQARLSRIESLLETQISLTTASQQKLRPQEPQEPSPGLSPSSDLLSNTERRHRPLPGLPVTGRLIHSPSGHVRYVSRNCGSDINDTALHDELSQSINAAQSSNFDIFFSDSSATVDSILDLLPPLSHCDRLKTVFLEVFSPLFHIIHEPTFNHWYDKFLRDPRAAPTTFLALLFAIFSIGVTSVGDDDPVLEELGHGTAIHLKSRRLASKYQSAAIKALSADNFIWQHNLETVKTLTLLLYSISHTTGPAWSLLGITLNIAIAIGCHVDPSNIAGVGIVEAEERRRCWAALSMLHTIQNASLGLAAPALNSNVRLPLDCEDEDLENISQSHGQSRNITSKMTYILQKINLYSLAASLCQMPPPNGQYSEIKIFDEQIGYQENALEQRFGQQVSQLPNYHQAQYYILSIYTNNLFITLHRPCLSPQTTIAASERQASLQRCTVAAFSILNSYRLLSTEENLQQYRWYIQGLGAFYALLAAATLVVVVSHPLAEEQLPWSALDSLGWLSTQFHRLSHRSDLCSKGARFLGKVLLSQEGTEENVNSELSPTMRAAAATLAGCRTNGVEATENFTVFTEDSQNASTGNPESVVNTITSDALAFSAIAESQDLLSLVSDTSHQQWLSPAMFSWDEWQLA